MKTTTQIIKWSPIILSIYIICYIIYYTAIDKTIYSHTNQAEETRGRLVLLFVHIIINFISYFMILYKIYIHFININFGFILSPVIGYLLDFAYGKNYGYNNFGTLEGIKYIFQNVVSINFYRFIITILLDLFITNPIHHIIIDNTKNIISELNNDTSKFNILSKLVVNIFPILVRTIISVLTYKAYAYQTRYNWAYTNNTSANKPIDLIIILIACTISACIFITYMSPSGPSFKIRIIYVIILFLLILIGNELNILDNNSPDKITSIIDKKYWWVGLIIFILFLIYGLVYPILYTMMKK